MKNGSRSRFGQPGPEWCSIIVLVILGTLLMTGHDGMLTRSFCGIAGIVFGKGIGTEAWQFIKKAKVKGKLEVSAEGERPKAEQKGPPG